MLYRLENLKYRLEMALNNNETHLNFKQKNSTKTTKEEKFNF